MKILFQGDSITDWGRDINDFHPLGGGYPKFAAEAIKNRHPDSEFEFINLGISGNQTSDLVDRW
ncbi:MAG: GDSL family lipase, partial [bacterium]|nr:GDSL family lipase [bacterium]